MVLGLNKVALKREAARTANGDAVKERAAFQPAPDSSRERDTEHRVTGADS
jgi:hypothetical protein